MIDSIPERAEEPQNILVIPGRLIVMDSPGSPLYFIVPHAGNEIYPCSSQTAQEWLQLAGQRELHATQDTFGIRQLIAEWTQNRWREAAHYHVATWNYPFNQANDLGIQKARDKMTMYSTFERDDERYKTYPLAEKSALPELSECTNDALLSSDDESKVRMILTLSTRFYRKSKTRWAGEPLLFRSSPSGGARHPIEAYFVDSCVGSSFYHVNSYTGNLEAIELDSGADALMDAMFLDRLGWTPRFKIILTCVFSRNWYRYREPRTFRTVHMDAGHICGTIELLCKFTNLTYSVVYLPSDSLLETSIGSSCFEEASFLAVGIM